MVYDLDREEYIEESATEEVEDTNDVLDNMLEACEYMMDMLDESTAAQRHFNATSKNYAEYDKLGRDILNTSKAGRMINNLNDKKTGSKFMANKAAKQAADSIHSGKAQKQIDKVYSSKDTDFMTDREKAEGKVRAMANLKGNVGHALSKYAKNSGADVKAAYDKAAAKADKKRAVKEACLAILSALDDIE